MQRTSEVQSQQVLNLEFANKIGAIRDEIRHIFAAVDPLEVPPCVPDPVTSLEIEDRLNSFIYEVKARIDGRPHPIDLQQSHGQLGEFYETMSENNPRAALKLKKDNEELKRWAECFSRGKKDLVRIGNVDLDRDQLINLQEWIENALKWHSDPTPKVSDREL